MITNIRINCGIVDRINVSEATRNMIKNVVTTCLLTTIPRLIKVFLYSKTTSEFLLTGIFKSPTTIVSTLLVKELLKSSKNMPMSKNAQN